MTTVSCLTLFDLAASAYENVEWINHLVEYVRTVAESKPNVRLFGVYIT